MPSGGLPQNTSSRARLQHARRIRVADRQHVAMKVHRRLRLAGRSRRKRDERDVFAQPSRRFRTHRVCAAMRRSSSISVCSRRRKYDARAPRRASHGALQLLAQAHVAERVLDLRLLHHEAQLARTIERHRRHRDAAGLEHGEPARCQHRRVRRTQQHAVARLERRDRRPARARFGWRFRRSAVGPARRRARGCSAAAAARRDVPVEQTGGGVEPLRIVAAPAIEAALRHSLARRQPSAANVST